MYQRRQAGCRGVWKEPVYKDTGCINQYKQAALYGIAASGTTTIFIRGAINSLALAEPSGGRHTKTPAVAGVSGGAGDAQGRASSSSFSSFTGGSRSSRTTFIASITLAAT